MKLPFSKSVVGRAEVSDAVEGVVADELWRQ